MQFLQACKADSRGRPTFEDREYLQANYYEALVEATTAVPVKPIIEAGFKGEQVKQQLRIERLKMITEIKKTAKGPEGVY